MGVRRCGLYFVVLTGFWVPGVQAQGFPFSYEIGRVYDSPDYAGWSIVELTVKANSHASIGHIDFHCKLKNAAGNTWSAKTAVRSLQPSESRLVRVPGEGDVETFKNPVSAQCVVEGLNVDYYRFGE